jgi:simple sugar transport system ATP-binding protein
VTAPLVELLGIEKRFGFVQALDRVDFALLPGEVHGLLGENGAGKSTLMHLAFGLLRPDAGVIRVRGREVSLGSPAEAKRLGIGMVHQHFTSIPALTVAENLWLARGRRDDRPSATDQRSSHWAAESLRAKLWEGLAPATRVADLPVNAKQRLELLQALATDAEVLLLDEPTAVLAPPEVERLVGLLREFARAGGSVVFITHKLDEALTAVDRVTVLRKGIVTWSGPIAGRTALDLATSMIGEARPASRGGWAGRPAGSLGPVRIRTAGLEVRAGELVGIAAVEGNGQRELLRTLAGLLDRPGDTVVAGPIAFIPEDRTTEGLVPGFSLTENLVLGLPNDHRWSRGPWIRWGAARERTAGLIGEYRIQTAGPDVATRTLSGGNQQKLLLARAIEVRPAVVIAENPTRGLDFQAAAEVHGRLRALVDGGAAVLVYSADLDEVLELAERVVVMYRGTIRVPEGEPGGERPTRSAIGAMMVGEER